MTHYGGTEMDNHEMDKNLLEDLENDPILNSLYNYLRNNQPKAQILNVRRYYEMLFAKEALDDILRQNGEDEQSTVSFMPEFSCGTLAVEVDSFEVTDKDAFMLAMSQADNFEFIPLTNGRIRLAFMFRGMMKAIA